MRFGRLLRWASLTMVVVYVGICGVIYAMQDRLLYFPDPNRPDATTAGLPNVDVVTLNTADGWSLNGWYRAARPGARTIVLMHGNSGNIGVWGPLVRPWLDAGLGVLLFDWRGYGGNAGTPNEAGLLADGEAALSFLAARGVVLERTALYGESLGSGIAVQIAARHKVGALILHAPYTSIAAVAADKFPVLPVGLLIHDRFDSIAAIGRVEAPVLVMHGERDSVIPVRFGKMLYEAIKTAKDAVWFPDGEHHNLVSFGTGQRALDFLARLQ